LLGYFDRLDNGLLAKALQRWMMDSFQLARYIEETDGISKPWLLIQLQLKKLEERRGTMPPHEYMQELSELHGSMMRLGEW
jgi:hypothetical protein